jgi:two-component system cell cycle sensor histidine kinase/response regulator CckA
MGTKTPGRKQAARAILSLTNQNGGELVRALTEHLHLHIFDNRYTLHPRRLDELGEELVALLKEFLSRPEQEPIRAQGAARAREGLGRVPLFGVRRVLEEFYLQHLLPGEPQILAAALALVDAFVDALLDGYVQALEEQILKDQEQLRVALSTALERQRQELHAKNQAIHTSINGVMLADLKGRLTYGNPAVLKMCGFEKMEELVGKSCLSFWGEQGPHVYELLMKERGWQGETSITRGDGSVLEVAISTSVIRDAQDQPTGIVCFFYDVSARKRLEAQFRQVQKMDALGQLAGGIVHDFNNLLTAISGYTQLALLELPKDSKTYQDFLQIKTATDRGKELTQELRIFTRQASVKREPMNLNEIAQETHRLLMRAFPPEVKITLTLDPNLQAVKASPSQMSQLLMNLCMNARDAILAACETDPGSEGRSRNGGEITIKSYNVELDWRTASRFFKTKPGRYVCLSVQDNGVGIPAESMERLFEPFFTTKGEKSGTGLGLAVVYGIVQSHEGFIDVHSRENAGSVFNVYLPVLEQKVQSKSNSYTPDLTVGKGTILVAEDDPQVQGMVLRALRESGYRVLSARNGADALSLFQEQGRDIDLVILDLVMPQMGGRECFQRLKQIDRHLKIMLMTGFTSDGSAEDFLEEGACAVITKPFELQTFTGAVQDALHPGRQRATRS